MFVTYPHDDQLVYKRLLPKLTLDIEVTKSKSGRLYHPEILERKFMGGEYHYRFIASGQMLHIGNYSASAGIEFEEDPKACKLEDMLFNVKEVGEYLFVFSANQKVTVLNRKDWNVKVKVFDSLFIWRACDKSNENYYNCSRAVQVLSDNIFFTSPARKLVRIDASTSNLEVTEMASEVQDFFFDGSMSYLTCLTPKGMVKYGDMQTDLTKIKGTEVYWICMVASSKYLLVSGWWKECSENYLVMLARSDLSIRGEFTALESQMPIYMLSHLSYKKMDLVLCIRYWECAELVALTKKGLISVLTKHKICKSASENQYGITAIHDGWILGGECLKKIKIVEK